MERNVLREIYALLAARASWCQHLRMNTILLTELSLDLDLRKTDREYLCCANHVIRAGRRAPRQQRNPRRRGPRVQVTLNSFHTSIYSLAGVGKEYFLYLLAGTHKAIRAPRRRKVKKPSKKSRGKYSKSTTILSTGVRLLAVLNFLKHHTKRANLEKLFGVDQKTLYHDRRHILPILCCFLRRNTRIKWTPQDETLPSWLGATGVIDCKSHFRNRVHPGHSWWYRGDKHATFVSCQMVCSLDGRRILSVDFVRGHVNDQGLWGMFLFSFFLFLYSFFFSPPYSFSCPLFKVL